VVARGGVPQQLFGGHPALREEAERRVGGGDSGVGVSRLVLPGRQAGADRFGRIRGVTGVRCAPFLVLIRRKVFRHAPHPPGNPSSFGY